MHASLHGEPATLPLTELLLAILTLVLYTGWVIDLGSYPIPKSGPAPVVEPWFEVFYVAGWAAVGCGVLDAVLAWMGVAGRRSHGSRARNHSDHSLGIACRYEAACHQSWPVRREATYD
jgi:hypothetical protein